MRNGNTGQGQSGDGNRENTLTHTKFLQSSYKKAHRPKNLINRIRCSEYICLFKRLISNI
jgi:hypothetical protein